MKYIGKMVETESRSCWFVIKMGEGLILNKKLI